MIDRIEIMDKWMTVLNDVGGARDKAAKLQG